MPRIRYRTIPRLNNKFYRVSDKYFFYNAASFWLSYVKFQYSVKLSKENCFCEKNERRLIWLSKENWIIFGVRWRKRKGRIWKEWEGERKGETGKIRTEVAQGRQVGPFATRGRPKVADARTLCPRAGRCERAIVRGTEKWGEPESGRNMVASPHAKTSRRRSPREPRLLFSTRLPTSLIKLSCALLLWHLANTGVNRSLILSTIITLDPSLFYKFWFYIYSNYIYFFLYRDSRKIIGKIGIERWTEIESVFNYDLKWKTSNRYTKNYWIHPRRYGLSFLGIEKCTCLLFMYPFYGRLYRHLCGDTRFWHHRGPIYVFLWISNHKANPVLISPSSEMMSFSYVNSLVKRCSRHS